MVWLYEKALFLRPPPPSRFLSSSVPRASRHSHTAYHAHSPLRPPTRRLQARFAAETRRILAIQSASRWTRHFASLHLHFICRYVAQLLLNALPLEPWHLDDGLPAPPCVPHRSAQGLDMPGRVDHSPAVRRRCRTRRPQPQPPGSTPPPLHSLRLRPSQASASLAAAL